MKKTITITIAIISMLALAGCLKKNSFEGNEFLMGTVINVKIYNSSDAEQIAGNIFSGISELEQTISWRIEDSPVAVLNRTGKISKKTFPEADEIFSVTNNIYVDSEGKFDITVGKLCVLWGIGTFDARVPADDEVKDALKYVNGSAVVVTDSDIFIGDSQFIDLGSVGKGYACDRAREILEKSDTEGACIAVGGSILVYGRHNNKDTYTIAVRDPDGEINDYIGTVEVTDCVVSTSGNYEHILESNGIKYHHILDTSTGYPVGFPGEPELKSVTVICHDGILSDALSSACFAAGLEDGLKIARQYGAEAIFVTKDREIITTGIKLDNQISGR